MKKLKIGFLLLLQFFLAWLAIAQDYPHVQYGPLSRQYLDIYIAPSSCPTPVYFDAHGNGGNTSMPSSIVDSLKFHGISIVAWESLTTVGNQTQIQMGWNDAELMFSWVKAHAATYNFDTTNFIIGGSSRGSILSWRYGQRPDPNNRGLYMYNALPSVWGDSLWWWPPNDVGVSAPPVFFLYLREPGCSTDPINPNIHDPNNGLKIIDKYKSLGIGSRTRIVTSLDTTSNTDRYQFLVDFALSVIIPCSALHVNSFDPDNSGIQVFPNPFSRELTFTLPDNEQATILIYDFLSRKIKQQSIANSTTINTEQFEDGIYFYKIVNSGRQIIANGKIIKN